MVCRVLQSVRGRHTGCGDCALREQPVTAPTNLEDLRYETVIVYAS